MVQRAGGHEPYEARPKSVRDVPVVLAGSKRRNPAEDLYAGGLLRAEYTDPFGDLQDDTGTGRQGVIQGSVSPERIGTAAHGRRASRHSPAFGGVCSHTGAFFQRSAGKIGG